MKRIETIKDKRVFNSVIKDGKVIKSEFVNIFFCDSEDEKNKYGIAISKKVGNAVIRNRLKRQYRCLIDENKILFKNKKNYIIMIKKESLYADYQTLDNNIKKLLERI